VLLAYCGDNFFASNTKKEASRWTRTPPKIALSLLRYQRSRASYDRGAFYSVEVKIALSELNGQRVNIDEPHSGRVGQVRCIDPPQRHNRIPDLRPSPQG